MVEASVSAIGYFMPIFAFLLVFIVIYAFLKKTEILGGNEGMMLFVSFILSSFFIVEASLVEFVQFNSAWFAVLVMGIFFLMVTLAFLPGKDPLGFLTENNWFSWTIFAVMIIFFITSSIYVFNWAINWDMINEWIRTDWFGMILLLAIAGLVSWKITE